MHNTKQHSWRFYFVLLILLILLCTLLARFVDLNILQKNFLQFQSQARILRTVAIPAYRGQIQDRNGDPLAISAPVESIWINPKVFSADDEQIQALAERLQLPKEFIEKRAAEKKRGFIYLKRLLPPHIAQSILNLKINGIYSKKAFKRYYPEGEVAAHVIGLTNVDDRGQEGLEMAFDSWLSGSAGKKEVVKDRLGNIVNELGLINKPVQGKNVILSIDQQIQYLAYRALQEGVQECQAHSGSVVVLNAKTGEVLAMVNQPSYNPNARPKEHDGRYRNRATNDKFEPGSVIKPFAIVLALDSGKYTMNSIIDTSPGWMRVGGYMIQDEHNLGEITLTKVLQKSSTIGAAKIMLSLKPQQFYNLLRKFGFGDRTSSGFPGESEGSLVPREVWYPSVIATLAYGYGIAVTPLQLAHAYSIIANHGYSVPVTFLKLDQAPTPTQVISSDVSRQVLAMLQTVVQKGGTATSAAVDGYHVAGKTGTAYMASNKGYDKHKYMSSFVGIAPVTNPQIVVAVVIREPQNKHFGGDVAAPIFSKVMTGALRILNIPPDDLHEAK